MFFNASSYFKRVQIDWALVTSAVIMVLFGAITMNSFSGVDSRFSKQLMWLGISLVLFLVSSSIDWSFLKKTETIVLIYGISVALLAGLFLFARVIKGARGWFDFGAFSVQPVDLAKLALIFLLAKYFSRRHVEIANIRHIIVSGIYASILFVLVALQPDFGGAIIIGLIWLSMTLVSGISKKHLAILLCIGAALFGLMWQFGFKDYQKARIITFIHPLSDIRGAGYNAYQSTIAVGSGEMFGKGIGYGTQSKLKFLPEYETDFIFAAFAEEWGFVGVIILFSVFGVLIFRIVRIGSRGATNFETLYSLGIATLFVSHFAVNTAMNIGLLPVTGITLPFMSYGGSHLVTSFLALGILNSTVRTMRSAHKDAAKNELVGVGN